MSFGVFVDNYLPSAYLDAKYTLALKRRPSFKKLERLETIFRSAPVLSMAVHHFQNLQIQDETAFEQVDCFDLPSDEDLDVDD